MTAIFHVGLICDDVNSLILDRFEFLGYQLILLALNMENH